MNETAAPTLKSSGGGSFVWWEAFFFTIRTAIVVWTPNCGESWWWYRPSAFSRYVYSVVNNINWNICYRNTMSKYKSPNFKKTKTPQYTSSPVGGSNKIFFKKQTQTEDSNRIKHLIKRQINYSIGWAENVRFDIILQKECKYKCSMGLELGVSQLGGRAPLFWRRIWWENKANWGKWMAEKGEIKDTERVGKGGNGVRGDTGVRRINVTDWFGVFFFTDGQRKSERHEDCIKADSHQRGTDARVCRAAWWELMAQDSFQMTVALTDINGGELTSCLKCVYIIKFNYQVRNGPRHWFSLLWLPLIRDSISSRQNKRSGNLISACPGEKWVRCK